MILEQLREGTRVLHARVEQAVNLPARLSSVDEYVALLRRYLGFYEPLEQRLRSVSELSQSTINSRRLSKAARLREDLTALGTTDAEMDQLPKCQCLPEFSGPAEAWGCLYVLEGATLGGQIIGRELEKSLSLTSGCGSGFFAVYGTQVGEMWRRFCGDLTHYEQTHPGSSGCILQGAVLTFTCFEEWVKC